MASFHPSCKAKNKKWTVKVGPTAEKDRPEKKRKKSLALCMWHQYSFSISQIDPIVFREQSMKSPTLPAPFMQMQSKLWIPMHHHCFGFFAWCQFWFVWASACLQRICRFEANTWTEQQCAKFHLRFQKSYGIVCRQCFFIVLCIKVVLDSLCLE